MKYVAIRRVALRSAAALLCAGSVAACSSSDLIADTSSFSAPPQRPVSVSTATPDRGVPAPYSVPGSASAYGAPITGSDGYPNINVDTARPVGGQVRSAGDQTKFEAELLAIGARQRTSSEATSGSAIQELQELGRRSRAEAERQIESGALPKAQ